MMLSKCRISLVAAALLVASCATPSSGIVRVGPDSYKLSRADPGGRYADAAAMKASVVADADAFAQRQGKIAVPIEAHEETMRVGHLSTIDYVFRLAAPGESATAPLAATATSSAQLLRGAEPAPPPVAAASAAAERPSKPAEAIADSPSRARTDAPPAAKADLYNELIKLDDLRKRGILTDAEFQALKSKLIAAQ